MTVRRTALVTGGNRGLGFEACRELAREGLRVVMTGRDPARGTRTAEQLQADGLEVIFEQMDVASRRDVRECAARLETAGVEVDALVNNAGVYSTDGFFRVSDATMTDTVEINLL